MNKFRIALAVASIVITAFGTASSFAAGTIEQDDEDTADQPCINNADGKPGTTDGTGSANGGAAGTINLAGKPISGCASANGGNGGRATGGGSANGGKGGTINY